MTLAHLKYQCKKLSSSNILDYLKYDRDLTLVAMMKPYMYGHNMRIVDGLLMNDILLHYTFVHILSPRGSNFSQLFHEDIFMLWTIKNNIMINMPYYIMRHVMNVGTTTCLFPMPFSQHKSWLRVKLTC